MSGFSVSWSVPDFGKQLQRERACERLSRAGDSLRYLSAPSGWGKTMVAAQYALTSAMQVLWIDAYGRSTTPEQVVGEILSCLSSGARDARERSLADLLDACALSARADGDTRRLLVVVDDFAPDGPEGFRPLESIHSSLRRVGVCLLVTTRARVPDEFAVAHGSVVLGAKDLALAEHEVARLVSHLGDGQLVDVEQLIKETQGHPALVCLMVGETLASSNGTLQREIKLGLNEWLDRVALHLPKRHAPWLPVLAILRSGTSGQLSRLGLTKSAEFLSSVGDIIPLIRVSAPDRKGDIHFAVHDFAEHWLRDTLRMGDPLEWPVAAERLWQEMGLGSDLARSSAILLDYGSEASIRTWLSEHGEGMLSSGHVAILDRMFASVGLHYVIEHPHLLRIWACAALALGQPADALGRAKAASEIASHLGDSKTATRSMMVWVDALKHLDRHEESMAVAESLYETAVGLGDPPFGVEACVCLARVGCNIGRLARAASAIAEADRMAVGATCDDATRARVNGYRAVIECLSAGSYSEAVPELSRGIPALDSWLSERVSARGNLAVALIECGRVQRARPLAKYVAHNGDAYQQSAFAVLMAQVHFALGETAQGLQVFSSANEYCVRTGAEYDLAINRVYLATCLRSGGDHEQALTLAERALERLSILDFMGFRRLAALEIAASLLALGDVAAARRWTDPVVAAGFDGNAYHALRAAMILAECDRRDGRMDEAVASLVLHREHIVSESSNWQMAMYCRAFPELLGLLAMAVGAAELPVHFLRMVLPEYGERALTACKPWLSVEDWSLLGSRVIGETGFAQLRRRRGQPVCRVRLFGGLSVTVADRTLTEKDWRKRKARLLFAMLVARQGRDIAREQFFEHLWPDLPETRARNNFYVVWSAMKGALMGESKRAVACPYVENTGGRCRIIVDALRSDVDEFEESLASARVAEASGDHSAALSAYSRLSMLYRGDLLPGDIYDDWFSDLRERYRFEFVDAMVRAAEMLLAMDDPCEALVYTRRALQVDCLREDLYQVALRCQIAAGQRSGAIDTFLQCRSKLSDELGLDPSGQTMSLYQEILVMEDSPRYEDFGLS